MHYENLHSPAIASGIMELKTKFCRILMHHPNSAQDGVGTWTVIFKSIAVGVCFALPGAQGRVREARVRELNFTS